MGALASCFAFNAFECALCLGCSCLAKLFNFTLSQAARVGHLLIILLTFTFAIVLGRCYPEKINNYYDMLGNVDLTYKCSLNDVNECIYRQLIYRASFSLVLLFSLLAVTSYFFEFVNKGIWIVKFGLAVGSFIGFWWVDNSVFSGWAEVARVLSFFWLLVQGLLFLDLAHDSHDMLLASADDDMRTRGSAREVYGFYIFLSLGFLTCSGVGLAYLFKDYTGCQLGLFFTVLTLLMGVILTAISLLNTVNKGLLTPCLMFAYSVFLCWYALLSNPNLQCNPQAYDTWGKSKETAVIIVTIISMLVLVYCIANGTKILNVFNPEGEGVMQSYQGASSELKSVLTGEDGPGRDESLNEAKSNENTDITTPHTPPHSLSTTQPSGSVQLEEPKAEPSSKSHSRSRSLAPDGEAKSTVSGSSGTAHERVFFHVLMVLFCSYAAMFATSWGSTNGGAEGANPTVGNESMWLKIVSQWVFLLLYCKILHAAYITGTD